MIDVVTHYYPEIIYVTLNFSSFDVLITDCHKVTKYRVYTSISTNCVAVSYTIISMTVFFRVLWPANGLLQYFLQRNLIHRMICTYLGKFKIT